MFKISSEKKRGRIVLTVEGRLAGPSVGTLEQCWRELKTNSPQEKFSVDLCGVSFIDDAGKVLLKEVHRQGAQLVAEGCLNQAIVREIAGSERKKSDGGRKEPSKKSHILFYTILTGLLLGAPASWSQEGKPPGLPANAPNGVMKLTLEEAVKLALKQNTTQRIGVINAAESQQERNTARAALLPRADLNVQESWQRVNIAAEFGGSLRNVFPVPGVSVPNHVGPFPVFGAGVGFSGPLFDLTLFRRYQQSGANARAAQQDSLATREQVILLVVSQYIGTLRATADVQASQSRVNLAQALYDQAVDLQKAGVGTGIDTLRANVELQNEKQTLIEAQADEKRSLFGLSRLLNLDPRQELELSDALSFFDLPQPETEPSIEEALAQRPEWKSLESQIKAAEYSKKASSGSRLPAIRFSGNWTELGTDPSSVIPTYTYTGTVSVPLFTGGRIRAEIARADLEIQRARQQQEDLRNAIALDVKTALINLNSARNEVGVANLGVQLSQQEVEQARDRFKAGVANNIEVIQAQDSLARANDNQINALYRFNQARADYARAIGQIERLYAK
ncbi:MAG TPA: TolC family protein [Candidatus Acidoferrum sp.]|jgi:outer membrane protein TolC/ABC-type transporter Mla MlaB component|nr:TolC family protein [Candidatus Acidoferrum sp.]